MDIKIKGTTKAGILAYDLDDIYARQDMERAKKVANISIALSEFLDKLRTIRKYDTVPEVWGTLEFLRDTDNIKSEIMVSEEFYRTLFMECLEDADAMEFLD